MCSWGGPPEVGPAVRGCKGSDTARPVAGWLRSQQGPIIRGAPTIGRSSPTLGCVSSLPRFGAPCDIAHRAVLCPATVRRLPPHRVPPLGATSSLFVQPALSTGRSCGSPPRRSSAAWARTMARAAASSASRTRGSSQFRVLHRDSGPAQRIDGIARDPVGELGGSDHVLPGIEQCRTSRLVVHGSTLGVVHVEVVDERRGWHESLERGVGTSMVVEVEPGWQVRQPLGVGAVGPGVGPLVEQGLDEALGLAVGLRPVGPGALVADVETARVAA